MDSFNKVISFVLGLVVVLVFFAVVTGKINLKSNTGTTSALTSTITPTPTKKNEGGFFGFLKSNPTPTPTPIKQPTSFVSYKQSTPKSIPSTGLPTLFVPLLFSGLAGGSFLRKAGKK